MSPQHTLASPTARRLELEAFDGLAGRRLTAVPDSGMFETLVISPALPFPRVTPLRLVRSPARAPASGAAVTEPRSIRLTRRGKLVLVGLAAMFTLLGFSLGSGASLAATTPGPGPGQLPSSSSIVVQPGDTLWGIASRVAPNADPRATVQRLVDLNALPSVDLRAGQVLALPS
jgi:LysM repeat protein